jgi:hypothetical protein
MADTVYVDQGFQGTRGIICADSFESHVSWKGIAGFTVRLDANKGSLI